MKKLLFLVLGAAGSLQVGAQNINPEVDYVNRQPTAKRTKALLMPDSMLSAWCIDANLMGGIATQILKTTNPTTSYKNALNANISNPRFKNGFALGGDLQVGYFFGHKKHFGLGTGFMYLYQQGNTVQERFGVEYQATDKFGNTFRQVLSANGEIKERTSINNMNIPLVLKYKTRFTNRIGFSADAGVLFNVGMRVQYDGGGNIDYGAIYRYTNIPGGPVTVYDNSPVPNPSSVIITRQQYLSDHGATSINNYFSQLSSQGYNVGLGVNANSKGNVNYNKGNIGFLVRPTITYQVSNNLGLNIGAWFVYQDFKNSTSGSGMLTDKVGQYNSMQRTVTSVVNNAYGVQIGARYTFSRVKDSDGDGIPDKTDKCPLEAGTKELNGCPDADGDGIPDNEDACPNAAGPVKYKGCPDTDNDGIIDEQDECPDQPGLERFDGCPDTDGDGTPDNKDRCPEEEGPEYNQGCPVIKEEPKREPAREPKKTKISKPVLFDVDKTSIKKSSVPAIKSAIKKAKTNKKTVIEVHGYTDNTGTKEYNKKLSEQRAAAVKRYLQTKGVNPKKVKTIGHGEASPIAPNSTKEGRAKNRRAVIKVKQK